MMLLRRLPSTSILLLLRSSSAFTSTNKLGFAIAASSPQQQPFTSFGTLPKPSSLFLRTTTSTTQTKMTATTTEEDPYIWLEEVESDKSLEFAKSANGMSRRRAPHIVQLSVLSIHFCSISCTNNLLSSYTWLGPQRNA